jgi:hypothetical protein
MFYFKKRNYKVICNRKDLLETYSYNRLKYKMILWGMNKPWGNADSDIIAAMGKEISYKEYREISERHKTIIHLANCYGRYNYELSRRENDAIYEREENIIFSNINSELSAGGKLYSASFGSEIGIITVTNKKISNLYVMGSYCEKGFEEKLLEYALAIAGKGAYIELTPSNALSSRVWEKLGLVRTSKTEKIVTYELKK